MKTAFFVCLVICAFSLKLTDHESHPPHHKWSKYTWDIAKYLDDEEPFWDKFVAECKGRVIRRLDEVISASKCNEGVDEA